MHVWKDRISSLMFTIRIATVGFRSDEFHFLIKGTFINNYSKSFSIAFDYFYQGILSTN